ncbi:unnamed protein product [Cyprideis torosa]|uniref:Uncharacterized protein n=1 Tax=Cyprideis torosa TaxID=163714 RepID=A0A7R8WI11_9CRUS|nr:unnamed protein product [Cyprideis torosa]CAG0900127.1 unnamed protein product [Cyprideis torosa]
MVTRKGEFFVWNSEEDKKGLKSLTKHENHLFPGIETDLDTPEAYKLYPGKAKQNFSTRNPHPLSPSAGTGFHHDGVANLGRYLLLSPGVLFVPGNPHPLPPSAGTGFHHDGVANLGRYLQAVVQVPDFAIETCSINIQHRISKNFNSTKMESTVDPRLMAVNRPYQKVRIGPLSLPDLTTEERIPNATRSPKSHPKEPFAHQNYPGKGSKPFIPRQDQSSTKVRILQAT